MKQNLSAPVIIGACALVVAVLGFFLYKSTSAQAGPPPAEAARGITAKPMRPAKIPHSKEEGMALYRQMSNQGR